MRANEDDRGRGDDREGRDNRGGGGRGGGAGGSGREDRQGSGSAGGKSPKGGGEMGQKDAAEVVLGPAQKAGTPLKPAIAEGGALCLGADFKMDPQNREYLERRDDKFIRAEQQTMERKIFLENMAKNEREKVSPTPSLPCVRDTLMALAVHSSRRSRRRRTPRSESTTNPRI